MQLKQHQMSGPGQSLTDMEGISTDRGVKLRGWNGVIRKEQKLQLARLKVELGNRVDHLLHLNVAKSRVIIPHDLHSAFLTYASELKAEATKEFHNRGARRFTGNKVTKDHLFNRVATNKGMAAEINPEYPLLTTLYPGFHLRASTAEDFLRVVETYVNRFRQTHDEKPFLEEASKLTAEDLTKTVANLISLDVSPDHIEGKILPDLGFTVDTLPTAVLKMRRVMKADYIYELKNLIKRKVRKKPEGISTWQFLENAQLEILKAMRAIEEIYEYQPVDDTTLLSYYESARLEYFSTSGGHTGATDFDDGPVDTWLTAEREKDIQWNYTDRYLRFLSLKGRSDEEIN